MLPLILLILVAIADLGRVYNSLVAVEAAAREAADFGSFHATYWTDVNRPVTVALMEKRACTAAAGSHLEGYAEPPGTVDHATCTNPTFSYTLEPDNPSCADPMTDPSCIVHVRVDMDFRLFLGLPPLPTMFQIGRDSRFRIADLTPP